LDLRADRFPITLAGRFLSPEAASPAADVDNFKMERWDVDAEAARREARWREFEAAATAVVVARPL
jgi:chaperone required for assembly of F1-ATPase